MHTIRHPSSPIAFESYRIMPPRPVKRSRGAGSTTNLPTALRDELGLDLPSGQGGEGSGASGSSRRRERAALFAARGRRDRGAGGHALGRKEMRKAQRQDKKQSKGQRYAVPSQGPDPNRSARRSSVVDEKRLTKADEEKQGQASSFKGEKSAGKAKVTEKERREQGATRKGQQQRHVSEQTETPLQRLMRKQGQNDADSSRKRLHDDDESESEENDRRTKRREHVAATLTAAERNEEDEIAWLEAHLGMGRGKSKKAKDKKSTTEGEEEDGLEELLDDLDRFHPGMYDSDADEDGGDSEESDFDSEEGEEYEGSDDESALSGDDEEEGEDMLAEFDSEDLQGESEETEESEEEAIEPVLPFEAKNEEEEGKRSIGAPNAKGPMDSKQHEGRYIPPALRRKMEAEGEKSEESAELIKLRRSAKGILNRLGDNNIGNVVDEAEALYRQYSRAHTTTVLTNLILDTVAAGGDSLSETFIVLYAAFICSLHRIVGVEFGAHFVQELIDRFMKQYEAARKQSYDDAEQEWGKQTSNLAAMLAALYNLDVIGCPLVYDVIKLFLGLGHADNDDDDDENSKRRSMSELDVELLLTVVKACGTQLRHDDPTSLKSIVYLAHERQNDGVDGGGGGRGNHQQRTSMRAKFMLEALSDLRNNRSRATTANIAMEMVTKMRKFLGGLAKKHTIRTLEPLRVGLHDLRSVEKRGKWWLVGAAWSGYDFGGGAEGAVIEGKQTTTMARAATKEKQDEKDVQLLALARQHGMNTVLRQQIFLTLLSSEDYLDAVQRLLALTHKKPAQRREIVRVLLHCLGVETSFNPFYVVVGVRLSSEDWMATRVTLQYCLWDFLRRLGERDVGGQSFMHSRQGDEDEDVDEEEGRSVHDFQGATNVSAEQVHHVARAYGWWMAKDALGLDALRAVDFTSIRRGKAFVQLLFIHLLLSLHVRSPVQTLTTTIGKADKELVERVFVQGTRSNQRVAKGILVFFQTHLQVDDCRRMAQRIGLSNETTQSIVKARSIALETVRIGARVAADDDDKSMLM